MINASLERLRPGGLLLVVMSAPIIRGHAYVRDALAEALGNRSAEVSIRPLISEYGYGHAYTYRRYGISQFVRYLVTMVPGGRRSIRLLPARDLRFGCYRVRSATVRLAASISAPAGRA